MSSNRRRNANLLPIAKILPSCLLIIVLGGGALYYVNAKNEVHRFGQRKKELERELLSLQTREEITQARIAKLSSFEALRKRQLVDRDAFAKLVPVTGSALVVRISEPARGAADPEIRTVSNLQPAR